jgi:hypothetical protein
MDKNKTAIFLIVVAVLLMVGVIAMNVSLSDLKPVSKVYIYKMPSAGKLSGNVELTVSKNPSPVGGAP